MSEPLDMSFARNVYSREREYFRKEILFTLHQYDSFPINFEIKQHIRLRAMDLKPECLQRYRNNTSKISCNQIPIIGNSLRLRSMCSTELPNIRNNKDIGFNDDVHLSTLVRSRLPLNKMTYESTCRTTKNSHILSFERQLLQDIDDMINSIDRLTEHNRHEWLQPSKTDRQKHYYKSLYDDTGYSLPLVHTSNYVNDEHFKWKFAHDKEEPKKTEVEKFYDQYLTSSAYLSGGANKFFGDFNPKH